MLETMKKKLKRKKTSKTILSKSVNVKKKKIKCSKKKKKKYAKIQDTVKMYTAYLMLLFKQKFVQEVFEQDRKNIGENTKTTN